MDDKDTVNPMFILIYITHHLNQGSAAHSRLGQIGNFPSVVYLNRYLVVIASGTVEGRIIFIAAEKNC